MPEPKNPGQHYREAEKLLARATDTEQQRGVFQPGLLARAQVHATLATAWNAWQLAKGEK